MKSTARNRLEDGYRLESYIKGSTPEIEEVRRLVDRIKDEDIPVLIRGEDGTCRELIARAIHFNGTRRKGPFVCVRCAAIPEALLESELFGREGEAPADTEGIRRGKFEQAQGGTLFLDEIGGMSMSAQAGVLRVLEGKKFERPGGSEGVSVDVRVISATNRDLSKEVKAGRFHSELYRRISASPIDLPLPVPPSRRTPGPGGDSHEGGNGGMPRTLQDIEKSALAEALSYSGGNVSHAARVLGIGRPTFYRKAKKYGIDIRSS